jgi:2'-phosphotransferase
MGIPIRPDGYVRVTYLLGMEMFAGYTLEHLQECVRTNEKQRCERRRHFAFVSQYSASRGNSFSLMVEDDECFIRASQGHSIAVVESQQLLRPVTHPDEVPVCIHGTNHFAWRSIQESGKRPHYQPH